MCMVQFEVELEVIGLYIFRLSHRQSNDGFQLFEHHAKCTIKIGRSMQSYKFNAAHAFKSLKLLKCSFFSCIQTQNGLTDINLYFGIAFSFLVQFNIRLIDMTRHQSVHMLDICYACR